MNQKCRTQVWLTNTKRAYIEWSSNNQICRTHKNSRLEGNNIAIIQCKKTDKIQMSNNGDAGKVYNFIETLTEAGQEMCNTIDGLFDTLSNKFCLQHNKMIKSL